MRQSDPSNLFSLFHRAIYERLQIVCTYHDYSRQICPIILGHRGGRERVLAFQFAGDSSDGPVHGEWKCFSLDQIKNARTQEGRWFSGDTHREPQSCVDEPFIDVNTEVKDQPGRRPDALAMLKRK